MLAYVFWHWRRPDISTHEYETRQRQFHAALRQQPPEGFRGSCSYRLPHVPWVDAQPQVHEDWYFIESFAALGCLNAAAVSSRRAAAHDDAARVSAGGAGGLYRLREGVPPASAPRHAYWFGKPPGRTYSELFGALAPAIAQADAVLWMRQLVLGPAREFVLHATAEVSLPTDIDVLTVPLIRIWPE